MSRVAHAFVWAWAMARAVAGAAMYEGMSSFESVGDFESKVLAKDDEVWVITLYASEGCEACEMIASDLSAAALELRSTLGVQAGAVDVTTAVGQKLGKRLKIARFPAVVSFGGETVMNPYTKKAERQMDLWSELLDERKGFSSSAFKRWVSKQMPNDVVKRVKSLQEVSSIELPLAALVTERSTTSPLAKSLGVALRGRLALVEVSTSGDLAPRIAGSREPPVLAIVEPSSFEAIEVYEGSLKEREAVLKWLEQHALKERVRKSKKASEDDQEGTRKTEPSAWGARFGPTTASTSAEFASLVSRQEAAVIVLGPGTEPSKEVATKIGSLDGSGTVKAVLCEPGVEECGDLMTGWWRVYEFGVEGRVVGDFEDSKAAFDAAAATVPSDNVEIVGSGTLDGFVQAAVTSTSPPTAFIVFSLKDEVNIAVKAFARLVRRANQIRVAQYVVVDTDDPSDSAMLARFQVSKPPTVIAVYAQPTEDTPAGAMALGLAHYDRAAFGPLAFNSMISFAEVLLQQVSSEVAQALQEAYLDQVTGRQDSQRRKSSTMTGKAKGLVDLASTGGFEDGCADAQLCAIFLLDPNGRPDSFQSELQIAKDVATAEASAPYSFGWFDAVCYFEVSRTFDIDASKLPTLVAYAPKKQRFAPYVGKFDAKDLRSFLRGVLSGRVSTGPVMSELVPPEPDRNCAATAAQADTPEEDRTDIDDLMAEILAEEAAEKRRVQEEAEAEADRLKLEQQTAEAAAKKKSTAKKKKKSTKRKKQPDL